MLDSNNFHISIALCNDAMQDKYDLALVLRDIASQIENDARTGRIKDVNGNTVGRFYFSND